MSALLKHHLSILHLLTRPRFLPKHWFPAVLGVHFHSLVHHLSSHGSRNWWSFTYCVYSKPPGGLLPSRCSVHNCWMNTLFKIISVLFGRSEDALLTASTSRLWGRPHPCPQPVCYFSACPLTSLLFISFFDFLSLPFVPFSLICIFLSSAHLKVTNS